MVSRKACPEVPLRVEYQLTDTGLLLMPFIAQLIDWAKEHFNEVVKDASLNTVSPQIHCPRCSPLG
ncbi:MAG: winged helix-turn-helix transcriptional regulator [Prevotella sp.]